MISGGLAGLLLLIFPPAFTFILAAMFTFGQSTVYVLPGALGGYLYWRLAVRPLQHYTVRRAKNFSFRFLSARVRAYFYACAVVGLILPLPLAWQKGGPECFVPTFDKFGAYGGTMQFVLCAITFVFYWFGIAILTVPTVMGLTAPGALAALSVSKRFHFRSALYYAVAGMISAVPAVITCTLMLPPAFALPLASRTTFGALAVVLLGALGGVLYWQLAVRPAERQPV